MWDCCKGNELHAIYSTIDTITQNISISRGDAVIINRHPNGHSRLTYSYLLSGEDHPICEPCRLPQSTNYKSRALGHKTSVTYSIRSLLFFKRLQKVHYHTVINFVKETLFITLYPVMGN